MLLSREPRFDNFRPIAYADMQLTQLFLVDCARGLRQQERDHVANRFGAGLLGNDAVESE